MKTQIFFRITLVTLILVFAASISSVARKPVVTVKDHLQKVISQGIIYPEDAVKNCCTGTVDVTFTVDESGSIVIKNTSADNKQLDKTVKEQLSKIRCKGMNIPTYEQFSVRISFNLEG